MAAERRMSESILGYPQWEPEMDISATPALPAILAFGWEEHHKSITSCHPSSPPSCSQQAKLGRDHLASFHLSLQADRASPTSLSQPQWLWRCSAEAREAQGQGSFGLSEAK